ncbi:cupin domain-containing protein [Marinobacterium sp. D7]|uniref:cupin domain-containing protein n=1 Tax=Marinobacterium ramblicola TaxID=2849041 RepID=UPI001C2CDA05|nr:cupin domain-containing protein [Marinobacterium ramblicola]MBV1788249.1 cupin domain-containing protein [Marinobacterium ramblicola]
MASVKPIDFKHADVAPLISVMEPARRISGAPEQSLTNIYKDATGALLSGTWSSEIGKWKVDYSNRHEFCYLLEGRIVLTGDDGETTAFKAGDAFVIPVGFKGSWEVIEPVTKHYVILNTP